MRTAYLHHARNAVILSWSATSIRRQFLCRTPSKAHFAPFFWCPGGSHNESVLTTKIPRIAILIWLGLGCSVLLSRKFVAPWKETFSGISWERTPLACMWWPLDRRLHAGSVRSQESGPLRVSVVKSLGAAGLRRENPCLIVDS